MELDKKWNLVLGSQSPRRKELLGYLKIPFDIRVSNKDEVVQGQSPGDVACNIALEKARHIWGEFACQFHNPFLITADTIVVLNGKVYGKPGDVEDARRILKELSGKSHEVITGVNFRFLQQKNQELTDITFFDQTLVTFDHLDDNLLNQYLLTEDSLDKAGAYGIQGPSLTFISKVEGSYSNVVGLPLDKVVKKFKEVFGVNWRNYFLS